MSKKKILVADDEPLFLEMVKMRLEANNYDVITAVDGVEAIDKVKRDHPDAVLLDVLMPKISGLEALKKIRAFNKKLPVFIITASTDSEKFGLSEKLQASGFIVKSEDISENIKAIDVALRLSRQIKKRGKR